MAGFDLMTSIRDGLLSLNVEIGSKLRKVDRTSYLMGAAFTTDEKGSGLGVFDAVKLTDPMNIHWWKTTDLQRGGYGSWFSSVPVGTQTDEDGKSIQVLPMEYRATPDEDYEPKDAIFGANYGGQMPAGVTGIASYSTGHTRRDLFVVVGGGPIVSHHEGVDPNKYDRYIYEIIGDGLNHDKKGGFSTFTVVKRQVGGCGGGDPVKASVALNFTGDTGPGFGLTAFKTKTVKTIQRVYTGPQGDVSGPPRFVESVEAKSTLAYLSREKKGPLYSGHPTADKHKIGVNDDGETLNAGHNHTDALFSNGSVIFDGPIKFEPTFWPNPGRSLIPVKCFIQWDPAPPYEGPCGNTLYGKWAVWTENPSWIVEPPPRYPPPSRPPEDPPRKPPITGPPHDISPVEKAAPSRYGKPKDRGPTTGNGGGNGGKGGGTDDDWEAPRAIRIPEDSILPVLTDSTKGGASGVPQEEGDLEWQSGIKGAERRLVDLTGMTTEQWYKSPHTFHAFATGKIATTPNWSNATPYAYTYNDEVIYVEGETIQAPKSFKPGSADGGECFAPPEVTKSTARYADKPASHSATYFGLWGDTTLEWGYMAEDEASSHVRGAAIGLGSDAAGNSERLILEFFDSAGATDTDKALVVGGGLVVVAAPLTVTPTKGEIRCDSGDSEMLKYWNGVAWIDLAGGGGAHPDPHLLGNGSALAPAYSFSSNSLAGIYLDTGAVPNNVSINAPDGSTTFFVDAAGATVVGKLTVTGLIDPTGLEFVPVAANPGGTAANTIWQDSLASDVLKMGANLVVQSASDISNNAIVRGNGGAEGVQESGLAVSDISGSTYTLAPYALGGTEHVAINGGSPIVGGVGGDVSVSGGAGQASNNDGGDVNIAGGIAAGSGDDGEVNLSGTVNAEGLMHVFFMGRNAAAQTAITSATRLEIDTQMHNSHTSTYSLDTAINIGRLTINTAGTYKVTCDFEFESNDRARSEFIGMLYKNGTLLVGAEVHTYHRTTNQDRTGSSITYIVTMVATDYLEMFMDDRNGGANSVADACRFIVERMA